MRLLLLGLVLFSLAGCRGDATQESRSGDLPAPLEVLRQYQAYVDSNQFEAAQQLSTPDERERLGMLAVILAGESPDSSILHTRFINARCEENKDTAWCYCLLEDEYERYEQTFRLVRQSGHWRVDAPDEEIIIEDEVIEDMLESLDSLIR